MTYPSFVLMKFRPILCLGKKMNRVADEAQKWTPMCPFQRQMIHTKKTYGVVNKKSANTDPKNQATASERLKLEDL